MTQDKSKEKKKVKRILRCPDHSSYGFYVCPEGHVHAIPKAKMQLVSHVYELKKGEALSDVDWDGSVTMGYKEGYQKGVEDERKKSYPKGILTQFCEWLELRGYLDDDWWSEEPTAVAEFLREKKLSKPKE